MPATREQLIVASRKALSSPRIGKHGKRKITLMKERAYAETIAQHKKRLLEALEILDASLIAQAVRGNVGAIREGYNRAIGKPEAPTATETKDPIALFLKAIFDDPRGDFNPIPRTAGTFPEAMEMQSDEDDQLS